MILRSGPTSSMMSNVTNIRGDNRQINNPGAYRIKTSVNFSDSSPVGSIGNAPKREKTLQECCDTLVKVGILIF